MRRVIGLAVLTMLTGLTLRVDGRQSQATFKSTARLIVQLVTVRDKAGAPVAGLTAKDFRLTEDNVPQDIAFVEYQAIDDSAPRPAMPAAPTALPGAPTPVAPVVAAAPTVPGDDRYRGRRLLVFYFDLYQMPFFDKMRTFGNAQRYIAARMQPADAVALMLFDGNGVRLISDFTDDRDALIGAIDELARSAEALDSSGVTIAAASAFGEDDDTFNIFATDRQLSALQTAVTGFGPVPELKTLIYFGSGLRLNGTDNIAQMRATVNAAVRANVTLNPVDARGLVAMPPMGDATRASPSGVGMFSGTIAQAQTTRLERSKDALYAIAKDTGGTATFDTNDLSLGIAQAARAVSGYYMIGFYSTHGDADGRYRRVKVELRPGLDGDLAYRAGYYGERPYAKLTRADKERQLADALRSEDPITDIPMAAEVNYFQISRAEYFVPVSVRMPAADLLRGRPDRGAAKIELDVVNEIKDEYGVTQRNLRDKVELSLRGEDAAEARARPVQYETGFSVLPGKYVIKILARDIATGSIGTYQTSFTVPDLAKEAAALPTSSLVVTAQRIAVGGALYSVKQKIETDRVNPLVHDGMRLVPSVSHTFSVARPMFIFLEAYSPAGTQAPFVATVAFYRDGVKRFETAPQTIVEPWNPRTRAVPIRLTAAPAALEPGPYDCQVTVLDPSGGKAAFVRLPITLVK